MRAIEALCALALAVPAGAAEAPARGRLAVVIDDFGHDYKTTPPDAEWWALPYQVTFAVMPESKRTRAAAAGAKAAGREVIIHMPFDPFLSLKLPAGELDPQDAERVGKLLEKSLKQIPEGVGLNNHRSYLGTKNAPMMRWFMPRLKAAGLFFVDSRVSAKTLAYEEARKAGVKAAINDFFLEQGKPSEEFCLKWLATGVSVAKRRGSAIVIGHHYHRTTLDCLKKGLPKAAASGVDVVPVSALLK